MRSFLGLANYFRKFVTCWAALVALLQKLTRKDESFVWSAECSEAFEGVKTALTNAPVLALLDLNSPLEVQYIVVVNRTAPCRHCTRRFTTIIN